METKFYKSIPPEILDKLTEYHIEYGLGINFIKRCTGLSEIFIWHITPEKDNFWLRHEANNTFPKWSNELNRFID